MQQDPRQITIQTRGSDFELQQVSGFMPRQNSASTTNYAGIRSTAIASRESGSKNMRFSDIFPDQTITSNASELKQINSNQFGMPDDVRPQTTAHTQMMKKRIEYKSQTRLFSSSIGSRQMMTTTSEKFMPAATISISNSNNMIHIESRPSTAAGVGRQVSLNSLIAGTDSGIVNSQSKLPRHKNKLFRSIIGTQQELPELNDEVVTFDEQPEKLMKKHNIAISNPMQSMTSINTGSMKFIRLTGNQTEKATSNQSIEFARTQQQQINDLKHELNQHILDKETYKSKVMKEQQMKESLQNIQWGKRIYEEFSTQLNRLQEIAKNLPVAQPDITKHIEDHIIFIESIIKKLGDMYDCRKKRFQIEQCATAIEEIIHEIQNPTLAIYTSLTLGQLMNISQFPKHALINYQHAKRLSDIYDNLQTQMKSYYGIANCYKLIGDIQRMHFNYCKFLHYAWYNNSLKDELKVYDDLGLMHYYLGNVEHSRFYHGRTTSGITENKNSNILKIILRGINMKRERLEKNRKAQNKENEKMYQDDSSDEETALLIPQPDQYVIKKKAGTKVMDIFDEIADQKHLNEYPLRKEKMFDPNVDRLFYEETVILANQRIKQEKFFSQMDQIIKYNLPLYPKPRMPQNDIGIKKPRILVSHKSQTRLLSSLFPGSNYGPYYYEENKVEQGEDLWQQSDLKKLEQTIDQFVFNLQHFFNYLQVNQNDSTQSKSRPETAKKRAGVHFYQQSRKKQ